MTPAVNTFLTEILFRVNELALGTFDPYAHVHARRLAEEATFRWIIVAVILGGSIVLAAAILAFSRRQTTDKRPPESP